MRVFFACSVAAILAVHPAQLQASILYVDLNNPNPVAPYDSWPAAATNIQAAVDAASPGDTVLVTNGVYQTGGRVVNGSLTNRVVVNKALTLRSVNGAAVTVIRGNPTIGNSAVRCVYLTNNATLIGFTLSSGGARFTGFTNESSGGGIYGYSPWMYGGTPNCVVLDCVISGNIAFAGGGGMYGVNASNCLILNNVGGNGGGAYFCVLTNCTLTGNVGNHDGGGAYFSTL